MFIVDGGRVGLLRYGAALYLAANDPTTGSEYRIRVRHFTGSPLLPEPLAWVSLLQPMHCLLFHEFRAIPC
jgi:hypothetical protein